MPRPINSGRSYKYLIATLSKPFDRNLCLLWPYSTDDDGYGVVPYDGKASRAHRVAFRVWHARWPEPCALHDCDTPQCFNPFHLYEGTNRNNVDDRLIRGRGAYGERTGGAILTESQVRRIRQEYSYRKVGCYQLGNKYGVAPCTIHAVITHRIWKHL